MQDYNSILVVTVVSVAKCDAAKRPSSSEQCDATQCRLRWRAGKWSKCDAKCGQGHQTRNIVCYRGDQKGLMIDFYTIKVVYTKIFLADLNYLFLCCTNLSKIKSSVYLTKIKNFNSVTKKLHAPYPYSSH